jgi:hypothetical protein
MTVKYYGIGGKSYDAIEDAWNDYFESIYGKVEQMPAHEYHDKYLLFTSGILAGLNIFATRYEFLNNKGGVEPLPAVKRALITLTNDALKTAKTEYQKSGR